MTKTNAVRLLEQAGIAVKTMEYAWHEDDLSGVHAAEELHMPPQQIFKTLVARNESGSLLVFCIPVAEELQLKKAAKVSHSKRLELLHVRELLPLTGYVRGGCSPVGMKKRLPVYLDNSALLFDEIGVSAGQRGCQMLVPPLKLAAYLQAELAELT